MGLFRWFGKNKRATSTENSIEKKTHNEQEQLNIVLQEKDEDTSVNAKSDENEKCDNIEIFSDNDKIKDIETVFVNDKSEDAGTVSVNDKDGDSATVFVGDKKDENTTTVFVNDKDEKTSAVSVNDTTLNSDTAANKDVDAVDDLILNVADSSFDGAVEVAKDVVELESTSKKGFFSKLKSGLDKTRKNILGGVDQVLKSFAKIDEALYEELEEALIMADIGVSTTELIIDRLRQRVKAEKVTEAVQLKGLLADEITALLESDTTPFELNSPAILLVIGVNGVGKTTTIGKIANNLKKENKKVLIAAADTFRAAAIEQLEVWANRVGIDIIKQQENSDPAAVIYDAIQSAKSKKTDVLICDTAGRLHNKKNLMEELKKIARIIDREFQNAQKEVLLVLDATTGQNALQQAKLFSEAANITGIVLTKLDGTAKGGIIIAIKNELKVPVRFIGVGEGLNDLQPFNPHEFAKALFQQE